MAFATISMKVEWCHCPAVFIVALLLHCFSLWLAARALRQSTNFGADRICDQRRFFI
jgi:hypothetical protein